MTEVPYLRRRWWTKSPAPNTKQRWKKVEFYPSLETAVPGVRFDAKITVWWPSLRVPPSIASVAPNLVAEAAVKKASEQTKQWDVTDVVAAEMSVNGTLGVFWKTDIHESLGWLGHARLSCDRHSKLLSAKISDRRREELSNASVLNTRIDLLQSLLEQPSRAALWWAEKHPDKLAYLKDGSFEALIRTQPATPRYSIEEASDPDSTVIRNFLQAMEAEENRVAAANVLRIVLGYISGPDATPTPGRDPDAGAGIA